MIIAFAPGLMLAQNTPLSSLYDQYVSTPGFETTEILPGSVSFDWEKTSDNVQIKEWLQNIESIRMLKYKADEGKTDPEKLWKKMNKAAGYEQYTEIATVNADKTQVRILMIKGSSGNTREVAMLEKDEHGILMLTVSGNMDFSALFSPENMQSLREMGEHYMHNKGGCKQE